MALTPEREAVCRDCAESEIRSGGEVDRTLGGVTKEKRRMNQCQK